MKGTFICFVAVLLTAQTLGRRSPDMADPEQRYITQSFILPSTKGSEVGLDKCKLCVQFAQQATSNLLNIILNVGVVGGCSDLCGALARKTGHNYIGVVCDVLCDIVGTEAFVDIVRKADLNYIYLCELIPVCPVNDHGDARITSFSVTPSSGPQGIFHINFVYNSRNGTGTGVISLRIDTAEGLPIVDDFLHEAAPAGTYTGSFILKAVPDPNVDPLQRWLPGVYTVKIAICNGECGSKDPHSALYDEAQTNFTITV